MANYLQIKVKVNSKACWYSELQSKIAALGINNVNWQDGHFHITMLFVNDDKHVEELTHGFSQCLSSYSAFPLTIDKLDAFTTGSGHEHVIYLTSTQIPSQLLSLANDVRVMADGLKANYDRRPFKPHITLGRVPVNQITLEQLQTILQTIKLPTFECILKETEYRYLRRNSIRSWKLNP